MAERANARAAVAEAEAILEDAVIAASQPQCHLHGTMTACPCGAETGITAVAFGEGWVQPDPCPDCGKPVGHFGDTQPWQEARAHILGCRQHPDTARCDACGDIIVGTVVYTGSGRYHFSEGCAPGVRRLA